jgi:hypothetical protein
MIKTNTNEIEYIHIYVYGGWKGLIKQKLDSLKRVIKLTVLARKRERDRTNR